jgi:hypothetical protein
VAASVDKLQPLRNVDLGQAVEERIFTVSLPLGYGGVQSVSPFFCFSLRTAMIGSRTQIASSSRCTRNCWLKTSYFTKESALPARKQDLFSILQKKNEASILEETYLLHLAEIDDTITAGAKED